MKFDVRGNMHLKVPIDMEDVTAPTAHRTVA